MNSWGVYNVEFVCEWLYRHCEFPDLKMKKGGLRENKICT